MQIQQKGKVVVVTGASAGVGRATAERFAQEGYHVGLIAREPVRLDEMARSLSRRFGVEVLALPADVADAEMLEQAAVRVEESIGPIDVWVNVAMATVFAPVARLSACDIERGTQVTYLGQVNGMLAALSRMRARGRGTIINVGSALAYRSVPLQSVYCGAKFAIRGFTDSLRSELLHDKIDVHLSMVNLPAINTPQFDWSLNRTGFRARPVAPVYQPEEAARAIWFAANHRRREIWVGWSSLKAIIAGSLAPALVDRYLARAGYSGQLTEEQLPVEAPSNLHDAVPGNFGVRGRFGEEAQSGHAQIFTDRHRTMFFAGTAILATTAAAWLSRRRR